MNPALKKKSTAELIREVKSHLDTMRNHVTVLTDTAVMRYIREDKHETVKVMLRRAHEYDGATNMLWDTYERIEWISDHIEALESRLADESKAQEVA